jgi:hypothetical protein
MPTTKTFTVSQPSTVTVSASDPILTEVIIPIVPPVNQPPVANAGADQSLVIPVTATTINSTLNGSLSKDPEGTALTYGWRKASGPAAGTIAVPNAAITAVNGLVAGVYVFELRVVDALGLFGVDTMTITVTQTIPPPVNQPPVPKAGADQTIKLPLAEVKLDGSLSIDPDGTITAYSWTKTSGPTANETGNATAILTIKDMVGGIYIYRLTVTDNQGASSYDEVTITVQAADTGTTPAGTYPFTLTKNTAFKPRKFSGTENWNGQYYVPFSGGYQDYYFRFVWADIEKVTQGNYVWARFDNEFNKALAVKGKFGFGIFMVNDSDNFLAEEFFNGTSARYPKYVHDAMQAEAVKDYTTNGQWIPNWNSQFMLDRYAALLQAISAHITAKGWQDKVNYTDVRGYGQWGEWHSVGFGQPVSSMPAGTRPTVATYKRFIDAHIAAFPNWPLVMMLAAMDANWLDNTMTPPEVTDYILKAKNNWGLLGLRRDQWGATDNYVHDYLENNNRSFGTSGPFKNIIMERWKYAPIVGEPMGPGSNLSDLERQVTFYHATSVGNGNYTPSAGSSTAQFTAAEKAAGYYLSFLSGKLVVSTANDFDITLSIENWGNAVCSENYTLVYELRNSTGQVVWTSNSVFNPSLKIPGTYAVSDHYKISAQAKGTYSLVAVLKSDNDYRRMPLFNSNQQTDGYIVLSNAVKF